jgi:hypothetical protein
MMKQQQSHAFLMNSVMPSAFMPTAPYHLSLVEMHRLVTSNSSGFKTG